MNASLFHLQFFFLGGGGLMMNEQDAREAVKLSHYENLLCFSKQANETQTGFFFFNAVESHGFHAFQDFSQCKRNDKRV